MSWIKSIQNIVTWLSLSQNLNYCRVILFLKNCFLNYVINTCFQLLNYSLLVLISDRNYRIFSYFLWKTLCFPLYFKSQLITWNTDQNCFSNNWEVCFYILFTVNTDKHTPGRDKFLKPTLPYWNGYIRCELRIE